MECDSQIGIPGSKGEAKSCTRSTNVRSVQHSYDATEALPTHTHTGNFILLNLPYINKKNRPVAIEHTHTLSLCKPLRQDDDAHLTLKLATLASCSRRRSTMLRWAVTQRAQTKNRSRQTGVIAEPCNHTTIVPSNIYTHNWYHHRHASPNIIRSIYDRQHDHHHHHHQSEWCEQCFFFLTLSRFYSQIQTHAVEARGPGATK